MRKLMTVEDTFQISGRGLVVVLGPLVEDYSGPASLHVCLHRPDGSRLEAKMLMQHVFQIPPPKERRWECLFPTLGKQDIPIGTDIWFEHSGKQEEI